MTLALVAALAGMVGYGTASVLQGYAASRASGSAVLRHPAYVAGVICDAAAWLASLVALRTLPLFAVQAVLAGSLAVTVLLARPVLGTRLARRDVVAVIVVVTALAVIGLASGAQEPDTSAASGVILVVLAVIAVGVTAVAHRIGGSLSLATMAGLAFGGAAIATRAWNPLGFVAIAVFGLTGMVAYAAALERGALGPATAVLWIVEVLVPGLVGVLLLGDRVRAGWELPALCAVPLALVGCAVLALSASLAPGRRPPGLRPVTPRPGVRRGGSDP